MADTGEKQAKPGKNGNVPPADKQFGKLTGNKRNNNGRPKSFDALRKLAQNVLAEALAVGDQETVTRITALLRLMSSSRNPADRKTLLEYAYGKPKEQVDVDITTKGDKLTIGVIPVDYRAGLADLAPRPIQDSDTSSEDQDAGNGSSVG